MATLDDPESLPDDQPVVAEPEEPVCTCTAHCTADNVDQNCKACKKDVSQCHVSETQPVVDIYEFYVDGKCLDDWTQNLQEGETLSVPGNPTKDGAVFQRWYSLDDAQNRITVESGAVSGVIGTTVKVYAEFAEFSYVLFMSADGNAVVHTAQGSKGNTVDASDRKAAAEMVNLSLDPTQAVVGWSPTKGAAADETISFAAGTVKVYPVIKTGYWVTFDSKGGDYVAPIFAQDGQTVSLPGAARLGYTFGGWYLGEQRVESVSAAATLEANWIAKEDTQYTVIHWQENANDNEYSFKKSETKTGKTGEQTDAKAKSYEGFTAQTVEQQTIAGDRSTIVNVYYKRNEYTITFYLDDPLYDCGKEAHSHSLGCYGWGGLICKKTEHTHNSACGSSVNQLKITAKYGANISNKWPTVYGSSTWRTEESVGWGESVTYQVNIDVMPLNGKSFYGPKTADSSETAYYYVEVLPGETGTTYNGVTYKEHHRDVCPGTGYKVSKEDQYPITGFEFAEGTRRIGESYNNAKFYYTRNSYNIVFINKGNKEKTKSLKYEQPLNGVGYTPERPANVPEGYVFDGWYDNEAGEGNAFVFDGKTMPAQNITLYAKWKAPEISATVYLTVDINGTPETLSVPYGTSLKNAPGYEALMQKVRENNDGKEPSAWFSVDGDDAKTLFNPDTKLYGDVTLVPHFSGTVDTFKVTYIEKDAQYVDSNVYQSGSYATVLSPVYGNLRFLYWKDETNGKNGKIYKPGESIKMTGDVTLTAYYTEAPAASTLTYHSGDQSIVRRGLTSNKCTTVESVASVGFTAPAGYTFAGWSTTPGGDANYIAGNAIFIPKAGAHLYAVWAKRTDLSYTVKYLEKDTNKVLKPAKTVDKMTYGTVVEAASEKIDIAGYNYDSVDKDTLTIGTETNEITFYYTARTDLSYTVKYLWTDGKGSGTAIEGVQDKVVKNVTFGDVIVEGPIDIAGYTPVETGKKESRMDAESKVITFLYYKNVTLTAASDSAVYNGTTQTLSGYTSSEAEAKFEGVTASGSGKDVGEYAVTFNGVSEREQKISKNGRYLLTGTVDGKLTITPREAVITVNNGTKTAGRNDPAFTGTVTGLIGENDLGVVSYVRTNNAEAVGTYTDVLTALYTENANYDVRVINGTFVITAANNPNPNPPQPNPNPPQPNPNPPQPQPQPEPEPEVEPEAGPEVEPEVTPEEPQPAAPDAGPVEEIADEETPLAMGGAWALVNLILTVLTVLGSILLLIGYIGKKQKEREDENGNVILNAEGGAEMDDIKKKGGWRLASIIPAVAAVIAFILTENMRLPMVLVDKWTLLMVIIALVQLLVAYFSKKKTQEPEQPEQMVANA